MNEENNNKPDLAQQLNECLNQKDEWKDRCLRTAADFENYKRRADKERSVWISSAQSSLLSDILSIVDDFDRAFSPSLRLSGSSDSATPRPCSGVNASSAHPEEQHNCVSKDGGQAAKSDETSSQSIAGFALIHKELHKFLEKHGVTEIKEVAEFDPNLHEAIMNVESADHQSGAIVQVLQKGYMFKGQVLRPAKVSVAKYGS